MRRWLVALMLVALPAWASEADIQSAACRNALAALQAHESARVPAASAPVAATDQPAAATTDHKWRVLRAAAAHACLGGAPDAPLPPSRAPMTPAIPVPPVAVTPASAPATTLTTPPALPARPLPPVVTGCDGIGCWTSDGERLPQYGRSPFDPRVRCTVQGRIVMCL